MKLIIRLFIIICLLLASQSFYAQETDVQSEKAIQEAKTAKEHQKKINNPLKSV